MIGTWSDDDERTGFIIHDPLPGGKNLEREWGALSLQGETIKESFRIEGLRGAP